jgi:hypothetical protein
MRKVRQKPEVKYKLALHKKGNNSCNTENRHTLYSRISDIDPLNRCMTKIITG